MSNKKVYALHKRGDNNRYYKGIIIGSQKFERETMSIFDKPPQKYTDEMLLIRMSNGEQIKRWRTDVFEVVA